MTRRSLSPVFVLILLLAPVGVMAKLCGGDVDGHHVACDCGDVVVSDVVLGYDPVTHSTCSGNGLVVRAMGASQGVTVDLRGTTLRGSGKGTGVLILYGGPGGAHVISSGAPATIQNFRDGVFGHGSDAVALIDGVVAVGNKRDGVRVDTGAYEIRNSQAQGSGRDGFSLSGKGFRVSGTHAVNSKRYGYFVMGGGGTLGSAGAGPVAEISGAAGFSIAGSGHRLVDCVARHAAKHGVMLYGMHFEVRGCTASDNGWDGIFGMGMDLRVADNQALNNNSSGLFVSGMQARDLGGNKGSGNRGLHPQHPVVQCEISRRPCLP